MQGGGRIHFINSANKSSPRANSESHQLRVTRIVRARHEARSHLPKVCTDQQQRKGGERWRKEEISGFDQLLKYRSLITFAHF